MHKKGSRPKGSKKYPSYQERNDDVTSCCRETNSAYRKKYLRWQYRQWHGGTGEELEQYFTKQYAIMVYRDNIDYCSDRLRKMRDYIRDHPERKKLPFCAFTDPSAYQGGIAELFRRACKHRIKHIKRK